MLNCEFGRFWWVEFIEIESGEAGGLKFWWGEYGAFIWFVLINGSDSLFLCFGGF